MVKLRLRRQGRKGKPFYYIVAADARAPRDGRFIERIGSYNPNTNPATIDLNLDDAVRWLGNGAVPTDTCRAILSYKGALYKHHLNKGVTKGALTQDQADAKFASWAEEKEGKLSAKSDDLTKSAADAAAAAHKREEEIRSTRAKAIAERNAPEGVAEDAAEAVVVEETPATEEAAAEVVAEETPATEEAAAEVVAEETPATEEAAPEVVAEETPATEEAAPEVVAEETPATEEAAPEVVVEETPATDEAAPEVVAEAEVPTEETPEAPAEEATEEKA
ncbi:MAG: 30S ribosomal protein S16 [Bacteroidetes bacterium]|nr:MAG: 30S ribosomal protein S16 [Bacteroidota bacterium]